MVVTANGQSDLQNNTFTVTGSPAISGMSPVRGGIGAAVSISGTNLGTSGTVKFNGVTATAWSWSSTLIVVPVPLAATAGAVTVTIGGSQLSAGTFDVRSSIPSTATEFGYDVMGRVIQKTICTPMNCGTAESPLNLSVTYDLAGNETSVSFNGPTVQYTRDQVGRVTQVTSRYWCRFTSTSLLRFLASRMALFPSRYIKKRILPNQKDNCCRVFSSQF